MNGWTALHWAAKRNHSLAVAFLISSGADDSLTDVNGALAGDVTNDPEIRKMLKNTEDTQSLQVMQNCTIHSQTENYAFFGII